MVYICIFVSIYKCKIKFKKRVYGFVRLGIGIVDVVWMMLI